MEIYFRRGEHLNQWTLSKAFHNVNWPYSTSEGLKTDWPPLKKRGFLQQIAFELKLQAFLRSPAHQSTLHVLDLPTSPSVSQFLTWNCCRKGEAPLQGPESRLLSNTWKRIVRGDTCWQSKRFYWERTSGWKAVGKGTQENGSQSWVLWWWD